MLFTDAISVRKNNHLNFKRKILLTCNVLLLQEQKVNLSEERRQLHRAVEKEHRLIVAERAKAAIDKRLQGQSQDNHITTKTDKVLLGWLGK